jgi:hypothetical protein
MSRGPGRIERAIAAVLDEADAFTIEDLCQRIYGGTEKKHRVAVLRATRQVLKRRLDVRLWRHGVQGGPSPPIVLIFLVARARVRARETKKIQLTWPFGLIYRDFR